MYLTEIFGSKVFNDDVMRQRLPAVTYKALNTTIKQNKRLDPEVANVVANAMKDWALENGATHFTHWFQPLNGVTAEKHDSFISPVGGGRIINEFSGSNLIHGEPDASSFPSGGIRSTFEARGYTAWEPTSYAFIKDNVLCIPTAFCSYSGEALDRKTPLLRSMQALNKQVMRIMRLFGNSDVNHVKPTAGPEQEYFLIDEEMYNQRMDLKFTGRTLYGAMPPKGQELDDHYFGVIKPRVQEFMRDLDDELWKLGILAKTEHNEVAPSQHELAPIFLTTNVAADHNQLTMEIMKKVARRHGLVCILTEKPFAGVNGSGKHNNWSLSTDNGVNLLEPGASPERNIQFLLILSCILKAIDTHAELLRQSASDVGNDLRLGADEAPPAIVSIFLGEQLEDVVRQLVETGSADSHIEGGILRTGVSTLPDINKDATDRNRTSPFAFTGNKFEFRMVGSADSCASPITIINAIVAEAFCEAADLLEHADNFNKAVHDLIKDNMTKHQRIIFSGNGYSEEWVREAERRGLPNIRSTIEAASALTSEKSIRLFEKFGIFTESELRSREEIIYETYAKTQNIEVLTMIDMARKQILPACMQYARNLAETVVIMRKAGVEPMAEAEKLAIVNTQINDAQESLKMLIDAEDRAGRIRGMRDQAFFYKDIVRPLMDNLRAPCDNLEKLVDKKMWPFPTYEDLMFEV